MFAVEDGDVHAEQRYLHLFQSVSLPGKTVGSVAFVGGPVCAMDWHKDGSHFALAASRAVQPLHRALSTYSGEGHVQVWKVGADDDAETTPPHMKLSALLPHDGDTAWDVRWRPTGCDILAVCLADGALVAYEFAKGVQAAVTDAVAVRRPEWTRDGARTTAWSANGATLAAGTARGCIELYAVGEVASDIQLLSRVRAHEYIISRVMWLTDTKLASAGHDGTLRVRDIREPHIDVEELSDGLAWNMCLTTLESTVAVAGTDNGFIKAAHFASLSPITNIGVAPSQLRRKRVATGSIRDLVAMPLAKSSALFSAGGEGTLLQGSLPRPLFRPLPPGAIAGTGSRRPPCAIGRYFQVPVLQWSPVHAESRKIQDDKATDDQIPHEDDDAAWWADKNEKYPMRTGPLLLRLTESLRSEAIERMLASTTSKVKIHVRTDVNLCATGYDQRILISRLALNTTTNMIVVATHAGFITVLRLSAEMLRGFKSVTNAMNRKPTKANNALMSGAVKKKKPITVVKSLKSVKSVTAYNPQVVKTEPVAQGFGKLRKKRGRPRKYASPLAAWTAANVLEEIICKVVDQRFDEATFIMPLRGGKPVRRRDTSKPMDQSKLSECTSGTRSRKCKSQVNHASVQLRLRLRPPKNELTPLLPGPVAMPSVLLRLPLFSKQREPSVLLRLALKPRNRYGATVFSKLHSGVPKGPHVGPIAKPGKRRSRNQVRNG